MTKERLVELCKSGGTVQVVMSRDDITLIAGGETNEITAKQADAVMAAMQDGKIPTMGAER
jgi:hypothetical protein